MGIEQEVEMKNVKEKHEAMTNSRSFGEKKNCLTMILSEQRKKDGYKIDSRRLQRKSWVFDKQQISLMKKKSVELNVEEDI